MKISKFLVGAMLAVALASCSGKEQKESKDSLIKDYEMACEKDMVGNAMQILNKLDADYKGTGFTEAELERFDEAYYVLDSIVGSYV
ncbi:MAG: hypothetical protein ACI358_05415 [Candidatus Limimorpha sp.]